MLSDALVALATAGGTTLITAAATDAWGTAKAGMARLLGRGRPRGIEVVEGRLDESRARLSGLTGAELERARQAEAQAWAVRLRDLLEEEPDAEGELRDLLHDLAAAGVPGVSVGANHGVVAGRDVAVTAQHGAIAAGVIHGPVTLAANPTPPDQSRG